MEQETIEKLKQIVNQTASELSSQDKSYIRALADKYGVRLKKKGCASCYIDAAVEIFGLLSKDGEQEAAESRKYVLRSGVNVLFNGMPVNESVLNDEFAAALIARGFNKNYFAKLPDED